MCRSRECSNRPYFETPTPNISPQLILFLVVSHLKVPTLGRQHQKCTPVVRKWGEGADLTGKVSLTLPVRSVDSYLRITLFHDEILTIRILDINCEMLQMQIMVLRE